MKLMLGTAQLGRHYGVANKSGPVKTHEAQKILLCAHDNGIKCVDTAHDYGNSESLIGMTQNSMGISFDVVTKAFLGHFGSQPDFIIPTTQNSLKELGIDMVYGLLVHNPKHLLDENGDLVYNQLCKARDMGLTKKIGVSVATPEQAELITSRYPLDIIQVPCNLFDQRFVWLGDINMNTLSSSGLEVHVRSVFLQGLFFMDPEELPEYFEALRPLLAMVHSAAAECGVSIGKLALEYVKKLMYVDRIIIGVDSINQLKTIVEDYNSPFDYGVDFTEFSSTAERFINPGNWPIGGWRK